MVTAMGRRPTTYSQQAAASSGCVACRRSRARLGGTGRANEETFAKEVCLLHDEKYVATGGDCGRVYVWGRVSGRLVYRERGDGSIVNCVAPHPSLPLLAVSGIDDDIKLFGLGEARAVGAAAPAWRDGARARVEAEGWTHDGDDPPPPPVGEAAARTALATAARLREAGNGAYRSADLSTRWSATHALDELHVAPPTAELQAEVEDEGVRVPNSRRRASGRVNSTPRWRGATRCSPCGRGASTRSIAARRRTCR